MRINVERSYEMAAKVLPKVISGLRKYECPAHIVQPVTVSVMTYKNGRENGYRVIIDLQNRVNKEIVTRGVVFSEDRCDDSLVIYSVNHPYWSDGITDKMRQNAVFMRGLDAASRRIVSLLLD